MIRTLLTTYLTSLVYKNITGSLMRQSMNNPTSRFPSTLTRSNILQSVMRRAVGHALRDSTLDWRHHGVGMLQAYLHEGDEEVRVHVWHPSLVLPGFDRTNGIMHDHRFGFTSYVLLGAIYNEHWMGVPDPEGEWVHYACVNAREAQERGGTFHEHLGRADTDLWSYHRMGEWHEAGSSYNFEAREFHYSQSRDLTVTLVVKTDVVDGYARILAKKDATLIHAFDHGNEIDRTLIRDAAALLLA